MNSRVPENREPIYHFGFLEMRNSPGSELSRAGQRTYHSGFPVSGNPELTWVPGFQERNRKLTPLDVILSKSVASKILVISKIYQICNIQFPQLWQFPKTLHFKTFESTFPCLFDCLQIDEISTNPVFSDI